MVNARFGVAGIASLALVCTSPAQDKPRHDLIDARSAIREISANDPETKIERAEQAFAQHLRDFCDHNANEAPGEGAAAWLALVDEAIALPHRSLYGGMGGYMGGPLGSLYNVMITLPGPEVWPDIKALVTKRPPSLDRTALLILCARLEGDNEGILKLCDEYDRQAPANRNADDMQLETNAVRVAALRRLGRWKEPKVIEQALENSEGRQESFPRLTELFPKAVAEDIALRVLKSRDGWLQLRDRPNLKLAKQVAVQHLSELPTALWSLADTWNDLPYVQSLIEHYGYASLVESNSQAGSAQQIYFRYLALHGKLDEAVKLINDCQYVPRVSPEEWGPVKNLDQFISQLQSRVPHKNLWELYVNAAIASRHIPEAIKRMQARAADPLTLHEQRLGLLNLVFELHAEVGDLHALIGDVKAVERIRSSPSEYDPGRELLGIGLAVGDHDLFAKGIASVLSDPNPYPGGAGFWELVREKRFGQLEQLELRQWEKDGGDSRNSARTAETLCKTYYWANRPLDILSLLKKFPNWPAKDLAILDNQEAGYAGGIEKESEDGQPIGFFAAWALSKTGQTNLAIRILSGLLLRDCGLIPCYELLNTLGGASALPIYEDIVRGHPYARQPVLWRGDLLFRLGNVEGAEVCVREAIRLDPVGSFDYREKLNALLGQILQRRGDTDGAKKYADRVAAIRFASHGSDLEQAKLLPQARKALEQAIAIWPDDSALQAQLASCLEKLCLPDEAKMHYRKAFEFLPNCVGENSDGPSETWSMFRDARLEPVATEVLDKAVIEHPNDAEAYYARGMFCEDSGRSSQAVSDFRKAVALDPLHLKAWEGLASSGRGLLSPEEAQRIEYKLIDLGAEFEDDYRTHVDIEDLSDLGPAYLALRAKLQALPAQKLGPLFLLHSSDETGRSSTLPGFNRFDIRGRLTGFYFQRSGDIEEIVRLYHPTNYPLE